MKLNKTALLGKRIQSSLSKTQDMTSAERNDILYYLLYAVSAKISKNIGACHHEKKCDLLFLFFDREK